MRKNLLITLALASLLFTALPVWNGGVAAQGEGATLRVVSLPITGATDQSPLPAPILPLPDAAERDLIENLFVGLFRYDAAAQAAVPLLAESWTVSDDGLTWTFQLRQDMPWVRLDTATGDVNAVRPVAAGDFVASLRRACSPLYPTPASPAIFVIEGCYTASQADPLLVTDERVANWVGAEAVDAATLALHLAYPASYLPSLLTSPEFRPIPREFLDFTAAWPTVVSSGPYILTDWTLGDSLTMIRNPLWPDELPGNVDRIEWTFEPDAAALTSAIEAGRADFARLGPDGAALPAGQALAGRGADLAVLFFGAERPWVSEAGVRQALAWAIDRAVLVTDGTRLAAHTLTPSAAIDGPAAEVAVDFAPAAAQAALARAGYASCVGVPEVIRVAAPTDWVPSAEAIVAGWADVLGCSPDLFEVVPVNADTLQAYARGLIDAENTVRPHIWLTTWTAEYADVNAGAADTFDCSFGYFYSGLDCGPLEALIDYAAATPFDAADRAAVYARLEARLFGPAGSYPVVPLWADAQYTGIASSLQGAAATGPAWWGGLTL